MQIILTGVSSSETNLEGTNVEGQVVTARGRLVFRGGQPTFTGKITNGLGSMLQDQPCEAQIRDTKAVLIISGSIANGYARLFTRA